MTYFLVLILYLNELIMYFVTNFKTINLFEFFFIFIYILLNILFKKNYLLYLFICYTSLKSIWGLGMGIGDWGLGPIPNPQSPIPNPQSPLIF